MPDYGSQNAIIGDDPNYGTDLPEYQAENDQALAEYAKKARFSRTAEYKELKEKLESRIDYYRSYQPGGNGAHIPLADMTNSERGWRTLAADLIITEFRGIIDAYELAYETIKEETKKHETTGQKKS